MFCVSECNFPYSEPSFTLVTHRTTHIRRDDEDEAEEERRLMSFGTIRFERNKRPFFRIVFRPFLFIARLHITQVLMWLDLR